MSAAFLNKWSKYKTHRYISRRNNHHKSRKGLKIRREERCEKQNFGKKKWKHKCFHYPSMITSRHHQMIFLAEYADKFLRGEQLLLLVR